MKKSIKMHRAIRTALNIFTVAVAVVLIAGYIWVGYVGVQPAKIYIERQYSEVLQQKDTRLVVKYPLIMPNRRYEFTYKCDGKDNLFVDGTSDKWGELRINIQDNSYDGLSIASAQIASGIIKVKNGRKYTLDRQFNLLTLKLDGKSLQQIAILDK